jgi:hypothetical protein
LRQESRVRLFPFFSKEYADSGFSGKYFRFFLQVAVDPESLRESRRFERKPHTPSLFPENLPRLYCLEEEIPPHFFSAAACRHIPGHNVTQKPKDE